MTNVADDGRPDEVDANIASFGVEALILEKAMRLRMRQRVRAAILVEYEPVEQRHLVMRTDVYAAVGRALKLDIAPNGAMSRVVRAAARELGVHSVKTRRARLFRGIKLRSISMAEALRRSRELRSDSRGHRALHLMPKPRNVREAKRIAALWEKRLAADNLKPIDRNGQVDAPAPVDPVKADIAQGYFGRASTLRERMEWELRAWELHALDGLSEREVAKRMGVSKSAIGDLFARLRKRAVDLARSMPGQTPEGHETEETEEL